MSPYILGGKRMAWAVLRPTIVDFLESAVYNESLQLELGEITISKGSGLANKTLRDSGIREKAGATIIAMKQSGGALITSLSPDTELHEGDVLIAIGTSSQLQILQRLA